MMLFFLCNLLQVFEFFYDLFCGFKRRRTLIHLRYFLLLASLILWKYWLSFIYFVFANSSFWLHDLRRRASRLKVFSLARRIFFPLNILFFTYFFSSFSSILLMISSNTFRSEGCIWLLFFLILPEVLLLAKTNWTFI